jgi:hypothetical protein
VPAAQGSGRDSRPGAICFHPEKQSGNDLGKVLLPHVPACLPDRGQDVIRGHEALMELYVKKAGILVKLHPGDPRDFFDLVAHGVGATRSQKAALFFHPLNFKDELGQEVFFHCYLQPTYLFIFILEHDN